MFIPSERCSWRIDSLLFVLFYVGLLSFLFTDVLFAVYFIIHLLCVVFLHKPRGPRWTIKFVFIASQWAFLFKLVPSWALCVSCCIFISCAHFYFYFSGIIHNPVLSLCSQECLKCCVYIYTTMFHQEAHPILPFKGMNCNLLFSLQL